MGTDADPTGSMTDAVDVESVDDSVAQLRRVPAGVYHVRREVARGGMGIILEAWDARHGRAVAIKTLRHGSPVRASRFLREVRVTSELQHPSIIPLYEAGLWPSGDPYYAMRLVEGHSLAKAAELATTARERLALLPHLIALAEALAYAHERGIIHRDLKPANVLVGKFGETVVIDWGLAKRVDEAEPPPLDALPETGAGLTLDGEVLGTLAFMAPEQARGEAVDARADVYALGALAYHVLAGVGPYAGVTSVEPVLDGPPIAIDEIAPELPAELRAIVAKAMAREPGDRYPSAKELAADLKAFATGRLVSAMSYSRWMLLRRWVTRHRGPVAVAAVFVALLAITVAVSLTRIVRARDRADAAREVAVRNQEAAEKLMEFLLRELRAKLEAMGRLDVLTGVGEQVEAYYTATVPADGKAAAASLRRRGDGLDLLGDVDRAAGKVDAALDHHVRAQAFYQQAVTNDPDDVTAWIRLCGEGGHIADLERDRGRLDHAEQRFRDAVACAQKGVARLPQAADLHRSVAVLQMGLARAVQLRGDWREARAIYLKSREDLADATRRGGSYLSDEAWLARQLAIMARQNGLLDEAAAEAERAVAMRRELSRRAPDDGERSQLLGSHLISLMKIEWNSGRWAAARAHADESIAIQEALVAREPKNLDWKYSLTDAISALCELQIMAGESAAAGPDCERSLALAREISARAPDRTNFTASANNALWLSGVRALDTGDLATARRLAREMDEGARKARAPAATSRARQHEMMAALLNGRVELRAGNGPDAARALRRAAAITEDLWSQTKSDWHCQELIEDLIYLGDAEKLAGNAAAARQQHVHAHALALVQAKLYPGTWITALLLAQTYVRLAELQPDPRPFRELARQTLAAIGEDRLDGEGRALLRTLH